MDPARPFAEAVAVQDDRIIACGCVHEVRQAAGTDAEMVDLAGGCLCPGFIDAHHHVSFAGLMHGAVHLGNAFGDHRVHDLAELNERLRERAAATPPGRWVLAEGYDEHQLRERRLPSRAELDALCPDHPLLAMQFSYHEAAINTAAFRALGWSLDRSDPPDGVIERDRRGAPTGRLVEEAASLAFEGAFEQEVAADEVGYLANLGAHTERMVARGIVRAFDPGVTPMLEDVLWRAVARGDIPLALNLMLVGPNGILSRPAERLTGRATGEGDDRCRLGPLKMFMDGGQMVGIRMGVGEALRSVAAASRHAWRTRTLDGFRVATDATMRLGRDGRLHGGWLFYDPGAARQLAEQAVARGFSVACHAIGNEAIERALESLPPTPAERRDGVGPNRIEHFLIPEPSHIPQAAAADLAIAVQPAFVWMLADRLRGLGFPPAHRLLPLRDMLDAGLCVAGSSDAPVDDFAPLRAMWCATTRQTPTGEAFGPSQRIGAEEALALYTRFAAEAGGIAPWCGTLAEGKRADLVWLSDDPVAPGVLGPNEPAVLGTWVGGQQRFARSDD